MMHEEATQELSALLDGAVEPARKREIEDHLKGCDPCRSRLDELRATVSLFKLHGRAQAPALLKTRILAAAMEPEQPAVVAMSKVWKPALTWSFVAASALFIASSAIKSSMPGLFEDTQSAMISNEGFARSASSSFDVEAEEKSFAAPAPAPAAVAGAAFAKERQLNRAASRSRAPARAVEIGGYLGASKSMAGGAGAAMPAEGDSMSETESKYSGAQARGPVPALRLFRDEVPFKSYWRSATEAPAPAVDFRTHMVAILTEPPSGSRWLAVGVDANDEGPVVQYRRIPAPQLPPGAPGLPPSFQILPKTTAIVSLHEVR